MFENALQKAPPIVNARGGRKNCGIKKKKEKETGENQTKCVSCKRVSKCVLIMYEHP